MARGDFGNILAGISTFGQARAKRIADEQRDSAEKARQDQKAILLSMQIEGAKRALEPKPVIPKWQEEGFGDMASYLDFVGKLEAAKRGPEKSPTPHYDGGRGGFVTPQGFTPVPGLPPVPRTAAQDAAQQERTQHRSEVTEERLRGQYNTDPTFKNASTVAAQLEAVRAASRINTPQSDMAMLFAFMKMLDPTSVVRESEYATAENARGIPESVRNVYNKALKGNFLTAQQRAGFLQQAEALAGASRQALRPIIGRFGGLARRKGVDSASVVFDPFEASSPNASGTNATQAVVPLQPLSPNNKALRGRRP